MPLITKAYLPVRIRLVDVLVAGKLVDTQKVSYHLVGLIMKEFHFPLSGREANYFTTDVSINSISEASAQLQRLQGFSQGEVGFT